MIVSGVNQLIAKLIYGRGLSFRDGHYLITGEGCDNLSKYFKISRCSGGCLNDRELVFGRSQKGPVTAQTMVSALFVNSGLVDYSGIAAADHCMDNQQMSRSGFKTSPQAQFLCWTEGFNTRNIKYIPALESLAPP
jgi:hypothetical protein